MARFYASIQGSRGEATRMGGEGSGIHGHIRGWNVGARITVHVGDDGEDVVTVWRTTGSSGSGLSEQIASFTASSKIRAIARFE